MSEAQADRRAYNRAYMRRWRNQGITANGNGSGKNN